MYTYPWYHWLTFFYLYCFIGWIFESTYVSLKERCWVNRGFLHLPALPLYGFGAIMMLWISIPFRKTPVLLYFAGVLATTVLEYITGFLMERLFKVRYWDYSNQKFHFRGHICLSSSIAWGFLTLFMTYVIHQPLARMLLGFPPSLEYGFLITLSGLFAADTIRTTQTALDLGNMLESMTKIKAELERTQVQLASLKVRTNQKITKRKRKVYENIKEKESHLIDHITRLNGKYQKLAGRINPNQEKRRYKLLLRNPSATSGRFSAALKEVRERIKNGD